jgi:hypothetical protein
MKLGRAIWFCTMLVGVMGAANAENVRKTAEASMLVTGVVEVNPDGSLHGFTLDHPEKLPAAVVDVVNKNIASWDFTLSSATTTVTRSKVSMRVLAKPLGNGDFSVSLAGASFGEDNRSTGEDVSFKTRWPTPRYPQLAVSARVSGTVYLLVRVGRDGTVQEAIAEQVNLEQYGSNNDMNLFRKALADASLQAARQWTYNPPTHGHEVDAPYWVVRVPVKFNLNGVTGPNRDQSYGHWNAYIPGPRQSAPWVSQALLSEAPDAVPDDALHTGNSGLRLTTALSGS